jgi:hypothetical protein
MDQVRLQEAQYRLEHHHSDGSWAPMEPQRAHHDAAEHDPERRWSVGRIFRCTRCDEAVTVVPDDQGLPEPD